MAESTATVYGDSRSGNCYKVALVCANLGIEARWQEVDVVRGETRSAGFLAINPQGKVPVVVLGDGRVLTESNAILYYLADGSDLVGRDIFERASVLRWMFFEQYSLEPYLARARYLVRFQGNPPERAEELRAIREQGNRALDIVENVLTGSRYIANDRYSIADISLYAYTHIAPEGGFELAAYPHTRAWLERVAGRPGHVPMRDRSNP